MDEAELTKHIIESIGKSGEIDDLLIEICESTGMAWADAEALVARVREEQAHVISSRQFLLLSALALVIFIGGAGILGYGIYTLIKGITTNRPMFPNDVTTYFAPVIIAGANPLSSLEAAITPYVRMFVEFVLSPVSAIILGLSMIFGSLRGMQDTWRELINHWLEKTNAR